MSDEQPLSERDRAWLEHIRNCDNGCLSTYAKTNDLDVQRLYVTKSRLKSKGVLGGCPSKQLVRVQAPRGVASIGEGFYRAHLHNGVVLEVSMGRGDWNSILSTTAGCHDAPSG